MVVLWDSKFRRLFAITKFATTPTLVDNNNGCINISEPAKCETFNILSCHAIHTFILTIPVALNKSNFFFFAFVTKNVQVQFSFQNEYAVVLN